MTHKQLPVEVQLIDDVKTCTDCQWFWGGIPPYGPFPAFDWNDPFPKAIKDGPEKSSADPVYWTEVKQVKGPRVEPAVLRGCRKAPIMTIGINPNMTAFFAGAKSATWAYPYFERDETYAYYYRHATIYQESFDLDDLQSQVVPGSEIQAEHNGTVSVNRSDTYRWLSLVFTYDIDGKKTVIKREEAWLPDQRLVIFARDTGHSETLMLDEYNDPSTPALTDIIATDSIPADQFSLAVTGVRKGDLIAARIEPQHNKRIRLFANSTGYYDRMTPVLNTLTGYLKHQGFEHCDLEIAEDVSMHDMVGCASPGWGDRYNIPTEWISGKCVDDNQYMFKQLIQSKPRVVFIVSGSSLDMFAPSFLRLGGTFDLHYQDKDAFELLQETSTNRHTLSWDDGDTSFCSRVIVTPHFSYGDNFQQQSRFALDAWQTFKSTYPKDLEVLQQQKRIKSRRDADKVQIVFIDSENDPIQSTISEHAWSELLICHINPYALIQSALAHEHAHHPLISDKKAQHLDRAPGDCAFCVNERWTFPEGCEYGLAKPI